jgi:hypothetical protein
MASKVLLSWIEGALRGLAHVAKTHTCGHSHPWTQHNTIEDRWYQPNRVSTSAAVKAVSECPGSRLGCNRQS